MSYIAVIAVRVFLALLLCIPLGLRADLVITQLAQQGVAISDGETRILIDGLVVEPYSVYGGLQAAAREHFESLTGPFADIDLALVSHRHHEHNQPAFACQFMRASRQTRMVTSPQVLGLMREKCRDLVTTSDRFLEINPPRGEPYVERLGGANITVFPLSHGTRKYARIQHFGHLIDIDGKKILHLGDAAMSPEDFEIAGLDHFAVDVVLAPFWYFQPGPGAAIVERFLNAPLQIAVHIPPGEMVEVLAHLAQNFPRVRVLQNPLDEVKFNPANNAQPESKP